MSKFLDHYNFFSLYINMREKTYYKSKRETIVNRANDYYKNSKEQLRQRARNMYS